MGCNNGSDFNRWLCAKLKESQKEQRICLNTAAPAFLPVDVNNPTIEEVKLWVNINLNYVQKNNGTQIVYYIDGGTCEEPDFVWVLNNREITLVKEPIKVHTNSTQAIDYTGVELPVTAGVNTGDTHTCQFSDGNTVFYTYNNGWIPDFMIEKVDVSTNKLLFYGLYSEISDGKMPNKIGSDWLTVSGSVGSETYQCPNATPYIDADTDYIWFNTNGDQRIVSTSELIGYDLQRTPVKYDNSTPYQIRAIAIIKSGETLTESEKNIIFKYFELPVFWDGLLNIYGRIKGNRSGEQQLWTPEILLGSEIILNAGAYGQTDWVDSNSDGLADSWLFYSTGTGTKSIVTGNGFTGNAQRFGCTESGKVTELYQYYAFVTGQEYLISLKYRTNNELFHLQLGTSMSSNLPVNTGDAQLFSCTIMAAETTMFEILAIDGIADTYLDVDEISIKQIL